MGTYTTFGNLVHDTASDFGPRLAEARFRPASTKATISGHGASMGVMNNVSDQRYHNNAVDERKDREMGNLSIQIRTVFSTIGTWINVYLTNLLFRNRVRYTSSR